MQIKSIRVKNYRCIQDETLHCEALTALVGANGCGKSTFLRALHNFYEPSPTIRSTEFYDDGPGCEIAVSVTYEGLSLQAKELFASYLQNDALTVERVFTISEAGKLHSAFHGSTLQSPAFDAIRESLLKKDRGASAKAEFVKVRAETAFQDLPPCPTTISAIEPVLREWESSHPNECVRARDDGQFFGFTEVARGYLGRYTKLLFIPAVRDAANDANEGKGSVFSELMDLVVRSALANRPSVAELKLEMRRRYQDVLNPADIEELKQLEEKLSENLGIYVSSAKVAISWLPLPEIDIPMPRADIRLLEDDYASPVSQTGHGLQRAFILALLQYLTVTRLSQASMTVDAGAPGSVANLILAIEEPELYQHPSRQRHFANVLRKLAIGAIAGVANTTQVMYATHSPLFVSIEAIDELRVLRKRVQTQGRPRVGHIISTRLDDVANTLWEVDGRQGAPYTKDSLTARLRALMTPWMNEGFFADAVVLVEGEDDRAALLGAARSNDIDLESEGIAVIPCSGKNNLDRPFVIFNSLRIPVYVLWDSDFKGANSASSSQEDPSAKANRRLLRLLGSNEEDWPDRIEGTFACFKTNLEKTIKQEVGNENFTRHLSACAAELGILHMQQAEKNPEVLAIVLKRARLEGFRASSLISIVERIRGLVHGVGNARKDEECSTEPSLGIPDIGPETRAEAV